MATNSGTTARTYWVPLDSDGDPLPPLALSEAGAIPAMVLRPTVTFDSPATQQLVGIPHRVPTVLGSGLIAAVTAAVYGATLAKITAGPGVLVYAQPQSGLAVTVPAQILDAPGLAPNQVESATPTTVTMAFPSNAQPLSGFGVAVLPLTAADKATFAAADGTTLWTLCPAQTASTVNVAGSSVTVPAAGLAERQTISRDTEVFGAASGIFALVK